MVRAFLLHPHVASMVVGELDDHHPLVLGQGRGNQFHELLLTLDIDGRKELVLVNRLQQLFVFVLALPLGIREGWRAPERTLQLQLRGALIRQLDEFVGSRHPPILRAFRTQEIGGVFGGLSHERTHLGVGGLEVDGEPLLP